MLNADGTVDTERCRILVQTALRYGMNVTFHRAFDRSNNLFQAMEAVIGLGCDRILTSGGYETAIAGAEVIRQLIEQADDRIIIMPGAGITPENAEWLIKKTGLKEMHGTFRSLTAGRMVYRNPQFGNSEQEYQTWVADAEKIKKIINF
jgi:copper homeostasis protein